MTIDAVAEEQEVIGDGIKLLHLLTPLPNRLSDLLRARAIGEPSHAAYGPFGGDVPLAS